LFYLGGILLITIGFVHSYLGERYILIRLFRRDDLPKFALLGTLQPWLGLGSLQFCFTWLMEKLI